jgi:hypothetical protein
VIVLNKILHLYSTIPKQFNEYSICMIRIMPRLKGKPNKEKMSFNCNPGNFKRINEDIAVGRFSTITEIINSALSFYFEKRDLNSNEDIKQFLQSPEGSEFVMKIFQDASKKEKS